MKKMIDKTGEKSWLKALADTARAEGVPLPGFTGHAMGCARTVGEGRFATFKRRLVTEDLAETEGVEFTLWLEKEDRPIAVSAFREPSKPTEETLAGVFSLLKGWLVDGWTPKEAREAGAGHPRARSVPTNLPVPSDPWEIEEEG